ncbi:hypothetical protein A2870_04505 [Candidatus Curtissbacteria bacterium RIFCSPHIGHO2_01_FULL_41_11]|uniref:PsbP C-terminal domain-containing protein n=1 Tax=Candidatus Curtissbacteria bacterium RIFCSPHIGHO2_01_FULL_41_11 TaxID=1797711 RepID=A0A1F5G4N9_9BACT|nr:MAG: hypothetical protein A2870_04505 [Candidatus Curtissbacteria bacterium RIFCSPHIGHO2_01_FULL_41_11]
MKKIFAIVFVLAVLIIAVLFFNFSSNKEESWEQVKSEQFELSISYPPSWRQSEDQTLLSLVDTKSRTKDFKSYIRVSMRDNTGNIFGKFYAIPVGGEIAELSEKSQVTNRSVVKGEYKTVDGQTGFATVEDTVIPGPFYSEAIYVLRGEKIYIFRLTSESREELEREKGIFYKIIPTVDFL